MPRPLRFLAHVLGWLLTPLVAWAASFVGSWIGSALAGFVSDPDTGLLLTLGSAATAAIAATILWLRLLRRSPELREALAVTEEGVPTTVAELGEHAAEDQ